MRPLSATRVPISFMAEKGGPEARGGTSAGLLGDIPPDALRAQMHRLVDWIADYRESIDQRPIVSTVQPGDVTARMSALLPPAGAPLEQIIADLDTVVMPGIVHWGHPAFLGYFGSSSNGPALLGEMVAAALNVSAMTWRTSPSATEMETVVLTWIQNLVGLSTEFTGIVYDTASVGLMHALAAAREAAVPGVRQTGLAARPDSPILRIYASDQAHSSIEKAAIVLGIGESNVVRVRSDRNFRMDVTALRVVVADDVANGYIPLAVIATVGTTSTTSVDPVAEIADVCAECNAWLHVDAAYGGALAVLPEGRWAMHGVERADSVIINPHKWLFVPLDFSALFIRRADLLRNVFAVTPEYLKGDAGAGAIDYMDYGIQLGRRFRALKAWFAMRAFGADGLAARIREHCRLAVLFADWIAATKNFEIVAPVNMAVICFRYAPADADTDWLDRLNTKVVEAVNSSGAAYLTHTTVGGVVAMRIGIGNIMTTETHIEEVWQRILDETLRLQAIE